jgi:hypothetical protein
MSQHQIWCSDSDKSAALANELLGKEVHEQAIVEPAVRSELVAPHHTDRLEAHLLVRAYGSDIVGGWVDHKPVVTKVINEVAGERTDRIRAETLARLRWIEIDIDSGVPVHRFFLLIPLDRTNHSAVVLDCKGLGQVLSHGCGEVVILTPPAAYVGSRPNPDQDGNVVGGRWAQRHRGTMQDFHLMDATQLDSSPLIPNELLGEKIQKA